MKDYKYLLFIEVGSKPKTKVFEVKNKISLYKLGSIKWFPAWRKYCFFIDVPSIFDADCLSDIQDFINTLMAERKKDKERGKS
jgi:hypothetical protein